MSLLSSHVGNHYFLKKKFKSFKIFLSKESEGISLYQF